MATDIQTNHDKLALWRSLEANAMLQCPECRGAIKVAGHSFLCLACSSRYPVEGGVPLLFRPEEVESIPDQVMKVFNIPQTYKDQVETALTTLTRYKTTAHPEFANFFARFDGREGLAQTTPLTVEQAASAIEKVECLTRCFPSTLRSDEVEFRSIRIRNESDRVLFTDERFPLYLSYLLYTPDGEPIPYESSRSPLPCPLRPGSELTVPVMVKLPHGLTGPVIIRVYFLLANSPATESESAPATPEEPPAGRSLYDWLTRLKSHFREIKAADEIPPADSNIHWFDKAPVAEMAVSAVAANSDFPAIRRGVLTDFDLQEDVSRADAFLLEVINELRSHGIAKPRILEVGAGVYPISLRTCGDDATVIVSDISLVMQTLAAIMHSNNPAVREGRAAFASFDMMYPPFKDGTFDLICISAALHHIPLPNKFLKRLAPMLSKNGRFVAVREPCLVNPFESTYITELSNGFNEQMFELPEWREILDDGGLTIDRAVIDFDCSLKFSARVSEAALSKR